MREDLLQFIWQYLYFNQSNLFTEAGESIQILSPGELNPDQGPDFRNARVRINSVLREGPVELHINASDWLKHGHDGDANYKAVILHVVWENEGGPPDIPVLVLQHRVSKVLLGQYEKWMKNRYFVPCATQLPQVDEGIFIAWKEQLLLRRLYRRARTIRDWLEENHQHWEEVTWWLMARSLGLPVNGDAFEAIARSIPLRLLVRQRGEPARTEALLLGQAGLLEGDVADSRHLQQNYPHLQQDYRFLRLKHGLKAIGIPVLSLRMRPAHFPARRLTQLAGLFSDGVGWFSRIREAGSTRDLDAALQMKGLGAAMKKGLLINAFVPVLFAYGWLREEPACREKALRWLQQEQPEVNVIISRWQRLGVSAQTAADSQSLLELKKRYCESRRCLDCAIGRTLLQRSN
jgi:hypothetical protein